MIRVSVSEIEVSDGTTIPAEGAGVTLFVGPNNVGKSQSLRDILGLVGSPQSFIGKALTRVELDKTGSRQDFEEWVTENVPPVKNEEGQDVRHLGEFGTTFLGQVASHWETAPKLQNFSSLFVFHADATSRLGAGSSVASINFATDVATHPLHRAYRDPELESDIRSSARAAFGEAVTVDRYAGNVISLRVGEAPEFSHVNGAPSPMYMEELQRLPRLEEQGDGMRSYLGVLLHVLGGAHQITLIDEPEAFLHPPQARLLGETLARRAETGRQLMMATHSVDVVQGVLDSQASVTIVRLQRDGGVNKAAVLDPSQVRELWSDPLLRYSNLLDGLFHDAVVLCEGDADCRYYNSVLDSLYRNQVSANDQVRRPQLLFAHCGGKARIESVAKSLRAVSIPVVAIADFDILNDALLLERTVVALGGDFEPMRANAQRLKAALDAKVRPTPTVALREAMNNSFDAIKEPTLDRKTVEQLRGSLRIDSAWDAVKAAGIQAVPQGEAFQLCSDLLDQLEAAGLLVVRLGELERFVPEVGGHGPRWVTEVHERGLHDDLTNEPPRAFMRKVVAAAGFPSP